MFDPDIEKIKELVSKVIFCYLIWVSWYLMIFNENKGYTFMMS